MHVINACRCKYAYFSDTLYHYALMKKVETQDFASHKEKSIYSSAYNCLLDCYGEDGRRKILRLYRGDTHLLSADYFIYMLVWGARETQDFASLLGWRRYFYHSDKGYRDYSRKNTLSRCFWFNIYFFRFDYDWHCNIRDLFLQ